MNETKLKKTKKASYSLSTICRKNNFCLPCVLCKIEIPATSLIIPFGDTP